MLRRLGLPHNLLRPSLQRLPTFSFIRRFSTQDEDDARIQKENEARTTKFWKRELRPKLKFITSLDKDDEYAGGWIDATLKHAVREVPSPHKLLEDAISYLMLHSKPVHAHRVFRKLRQMGFSPTHHIVALMLVPLIRAEGHDPYEVSQMIVNHIVGGEHDDEKMHMLIKALTTHGVHPATVDSIVHAYLNYRGPDYVPSPNVLSPVINASLRFQGLDAALDLLARGSHKQEAWWRESHLLYVLEAILTLIMKLRNPHFGNEQSIARVVDIMRDRPWLLNMSIFETLITGEVRNRNPREAMNIYALIKDLSSTGSLRTTQRVFAPLFTSYRRIDIRGYADWDGPSYLVPPRRLYKEMDDAIHRKEMPLIPSTSLLNTAFRSFLYHRDYPGAIVALEAYARYGVPLDHRTYKDAFKLLVRRTWSEIAGRRWKEEVRWADRFLGVHWQDVKLTPKLIDHILYLISREDFDVTRPLHPLSRSERLRALDQKGKFKVPTVVMMEHIYRPDPWNFRYEVEPLLRLVRRAALANDPTMSPKEVEEAVEVARKVMLGLTSDSVDVNKDDTNLEEEVPAT